jgi:hypothetical protein
VGRPIRVDGADHTVPVDLEEATGVAGEVDRIGDDGRRRWRGRMGIGHRAMVPVPAPAGGGPRVAAGRRVAARRRALGRYSAAALG